MEQEIYILKKAILELEKSISLNDEEGFLKIIDEIIDISSKLKKTKKSFGKRDKLNKKIEYCKINTIPFIYKPITRQNYFEGNYLVKFAEERTRQLQEAKALDIHNEFWVNHKTIKGNVFGSVPKELLNEKALSSLLASGWKETSVNVLDLKNRGEEVKEIINFCEETFNYYILIKEELTNTYMILEYKI
jgi:hypothetical protein